MHTHPTHSTKKKEDPIVKSKCKNENKKKVLSPHELHSVHGLRSAVCGLRSAVCGLHGLNFGVTAVYSTTGKFIAE